MPFLYGIWWVFNLPQSWDVFTSPVIGASLRILMKYKGFPSPQCRCYALLVWSVIGAQTWRKHSLTSGCFSCLQHTGASLERLESGTVSDLKMSQSLVFGEASDHAGPLLAMLRSDSFWDFFSHHALWKFTWRKTIDKRSRNRRSSWLWSGKENKREKGKAPRPDTVLPESMERALLLVTDVHVIELHYLPKPRQKSL